MKKRATILLVLMLSMFVMGCGYKVQIIENLRYNAKAEQEVETIEKELPNRSKEETRKEIARSYLTEAEQLTYDELYIGLRDYEEYVELTIKDVDILKKAYTCVTLDHPELFYVENYKYVQDEDQLVFYGNYIYTEEGIEERKEQIDKSIKEIRKEIENEEDDYVKLKYVYEFLIEQTVYDLENIDNQNISSVFLEGRSVCSGYAKSLQYIMQQENIPCMLVLGTGKSGEDHAWNLVKINGSWYYVDITSGENFYNFDTFEDIPTNIMNYDYFCVNTEELLRTHTIEMPIELPIYEETAANYFIRENLYFREYDKSHLKKVFKEGLEEKKNFVTIRCETDALYKEIYTDLIKEGNIFYYLDSDSISYSSHRDFGIITFWLFNS